VIYLSDLEASAIDRVTMTSLLITGTIYVQCCRRHVVDINCTM